MSNGDDEIEILDQEEESQGISLQFDALPKINSALTRDGASIIKSIAVDNPTDMALAEVKISLISTPKFLHMRPLIIDRIAPKSSHTVREISTELDLENLAGLDEVEVSELKISMEIKGHETIVERQKVEFLARNQWGGVHDMASTIAAFVFRDDPAVARILKDASRILIENNYEGSINGYETNDPNRAYLLAASIWSAITKLAITYVEPPESFITNGQKIRPPSLVTDDRLANRLDATLFFSAALEAAGLNSVVCFSQNKVWIGVWIVKKNFDHATEPDVVAIRKAVLLRELILVETAMLIRQPAVRFDQAVNEVKYRLAEEHDPKFIIAVDIAGSRINKIHPLASHSIISPSQSGLPDDIIPAELPPPLDLGSLPSAIIEETPKTPQGRIQRWQNKLLDLTLRNRLINYRETKKTIPLRCQNLTNLKNGLAQNDTFKLFSLIDYDLYGYKTTLAEEVQRSEEEIIFKEFERKKIAVPLANEEMDKRLVTLSRQGKSDMQEGGANTLFLAMGFLRWKRMEDKSTYRAPLILIPIKLERKSLRLPFSISLHEDEARINSTLLELLKQDFDLDISELEGESGISGIDVNDIFQTVRHKIHDIPSFEVTEDLALSNFQFAKYLMWKDMVDHSDKLEQNALVKHLIHGSDDTYKQIAGDTPIIPEEIDSLRSPQELLTPLSADSSQLAAIMAASEGNNFILIGPPGTGKSQTITNIIAQCLGEGKTVLFVAEKMAALDVVDRRLKRIGLDDAVLQLHSNKANRKSVLEQLGRAWDRVSGEREKEWIEVTEDLKLSRDQLNLYVEALHAKGSQGFSVFDAVAKIASSKTPPFEISFESKDCHDKESYKRLIKLANELGNTYAHVRTRSVLCFISNGEDTFEWVSEIIKATESLQKALSELVNAEQKLASELGLCVDHELKAERRQLLKKLKSRIGSQAIDLSSIPDMPDSDLMDLFKQLKADVNEFVIANSNTIGEYSIESVRNMPLEELDISWHKAISKSWPASVFSRRRVYKLLKSYAANEKADPTIDIKLLIKICEYDQKINSNPLTLIAKTTGDMDLEYLREAINQAIEFRDTKASLDSWVENSSRFELSTDSLASTSEVNIQDVVSAYLDTEIFVDDMIRIFEDKGGTYPKEVTVVEFERGLATIVAERAHLINHIDWIHKSSEGIAAGLGPLVKALENSQAIQDIEEAFEHAYALWWVRLAIDQSDELRGFRYHNHEELIETFRKLDEEAAKLAPKEVLRRAEHGLPPRNPDVTSRQSKPIKRNSELGILRHQLNLKRPSMSIRKLMTSLPNNLKKLTPCALMSPLSVAQYLPADHTIFDLVIFDEASQIRTWDAIGAIARGRQTIIVGDPKQLPPTNFFERVNIEDEDTPEIERDMDSIIDEALSAGMPSQSLNWHYRSRDEALIAFSNKEYYDEKLITFPAPSTDSDAIQFHYIDGTYARGQKRVNKEEARAVVKMIKQCLLKQLSHTENNRKTLGVITFNAEQQSLILDLLDNLRRENDELEWFFNDECEEPLIVKNLENIQGDERDIMLFSITFGRDYSGNMTMNFGAMNNDGGERRLNVAITRARHELHVFSSIRSDHIDLSRTRAKGVHDLKKFLDYAERGSKALLQYEGSLGPAENLFEQSVADKLQIKGWEVRTQIGVSGFRIDLGIVHPDYAGRFLAGIECDGAQYHSSANARDRDKVRQAVLEELGWTILRVWSTDWFRDSDIVTNRLHNNLEQLLAVDRETRDKDQEYGDDDDDCEDDDEDKKDDDDKKQETKDIPIDPERFHDPMYAKVIRKLAYEIVKNEGPITFKQLSTKIARRHGWKKAGRLIQERVKKNLWDLKCHPEFGVEFYWLPDSYSDRTPFRGRKGRAIRDISRTEICTVIDEKEHQLINKKDPIKALSRFLGFTKLMEDTRAYLSDCVQWRKDSTTS